MDARQHGPEHQLGAVSPRLILGFFVIALGVLFTLDNFKVLDADRFVRFWPLVLVLVGITKLVENQGRSFGGVLFVMVGGLLLLNQVPGLGLHIGIGELWPVVLLFVGGRMVWAALGGSRPRSTLGGGTSASDRVQAFAMMSGNGIVNSSQAFVGGDLTAIMGAVELDLRGARLAADEVVLDLFAWWGGIEIRVPEGWRVASDVLPLLGGFEDKTGPASDPSAPCLRLRGTVVMGGIEVNHGNQGSRDALV